MVAPGSGISPSMRVLEATIALASIGAAILLGLQR
jgi:hypothetical protein